MVRIKRIFWAVFKICIVVIGLLSLSVLSAVITMKIVSRADLVKVPSIVGKDTVDALEQVNKLGLRFKIVGKEFFESIPENHIISQDPKPFELIGRDRAIKVILSKGSEKVTVPNVLDEPWLRAQNLIQSAGLKLGRLSRTFTEGINRNKIVAQNPKGNSIVPRGYTVDLLLSDGKPPKEFLMPDLKGLAMSSALRRLRRIQLPPGKITYQNDANLPANTIISQGVRSGYRIPSGETVDLVVSKPVKPNQEEAVIYSTLMYKVPSGLDSREVKIVLLEGEKTREIFHQIRLPGEEIELLIKTIRNTTARIYLDNELVEERTF